MTAIVVSTGSITTICEHIWLNCSFYDTSMNFGTPLENVTANIFGYRAIADLTCDNIDIHFPIWPHHYYYYNNLGKRGFVWKMWHIFVFSGF